MILPMVLDGMKRVAKDVKINATRDAKTFGQMVTGQKDPFGALQEKTQELKPFVEKGAKLVAKGWERVKEGPVGMWVREKRAKRLATKIDRQQQRVEELSGKIKDVGDDYASAAKLGEEQMIRVGKINKYAVRRSELAAKLGNHYNKKLEKPAEKRKGIEDGMNDAVSRRDALVAKYEKYQTVSKRFQERQASLLASRAYERSGEMASIAQSLSKMAEQMKGLEEDIATEGRVIETAKNDISKWDAKHSGTKQQMQRWSDTALNGRHGTNAARVQEVGTQKKSVPEVPKKAPEILGSKVVKKTTNDNEPVIPTIEKAKTGERAAGGEALNVFLQEVLREDLRGSLQSIVDKQSNKDVINGENGKGGTEQFIELWKQVATMGNPKVEDFSPVEIGKLKEHTGKVSLVEFGVLISEKTGLSIKDVKNGVEKIAERWNSSLEKQKQAA